MFCSFLALALTVFFASPERPEFYLYFVQSPHLLLFGWFWVETEEIKDKNTKIARCYNER